jgi:hypothetical protein
MCESVDLTTTRPFSLSSDSNVISSDATPETLFAIYLAGDAEAEGKPLTEEQLLCTLSLHQAALAIKTLLDDMAERIAKGRDREGLLERRLRGTSRT